MVKQCKQCAVEFEVTERDKCFLDKMSPVIGGVKHEIPPPTLCYLCRLQRKMPWRAELHLFQRTSDFSGKPMLSFYPPDADCKVYSIDEWYSDNWDALEYGRDFDFNRPFFEQFVELIKVVPLMGMSGFGHENSDYVNNASWCKNCYLIAGANKDEDCYYCNFVNDSKNCVDSAFIRYCELCYECIDCWNCYDLKYSYNCHGCSESYFLHNCKNCQNCFGSVNLVNKKFVYFNEQLSEEEYFKRVNALGLDKRSNVKKIAEYFEQHRLKYPYKYMNGEMNENASGGEVMNSRNIENCFDVSGLEDCKNCNWLHDAKDCMDIYSWGFPLEQCYECMEAGDGSKNTIFSSITYNSSDTMYSFYTVSSQHIFGCVGMKHKKYCIFNKQYTQEEYETLVPKIIEHMKSTGEWGEFFPYWVCPLKYNQSIAQDYFPIDQAAAERLGAKWAVEPEYVIPEDAFEIPDSVNAVGESICEKTLYCKANGKPYRIIPQEFAFYIKQGIPVPDVCFNERHMRRLAKRHQRRLYDRNCAKCGVGIQTAYGPDRPEIVYCEACYLAEVY